MSATTADSAVRQRLLGAICAEFKPLRFASELLARASGKTPRAAQNWLAGRNTPDAEALIALMANSHEIAAEVLALVAEHRAANGEPPCPSSVCLSAGLALPATPDRPRL